MASNENVNLTIHKINKHFILDDAVKDDWTRCLSKLSDVQLGVAYERMITEHKYRRAPTLAEFLEWAGYSQGQRKAKGLNVKDFRFWWKRYQKSTRKDGTPTYELQEVVYHPELKDVHGELLEPPPDGAVVWKYDRAAESYDDAWKRLIGAEG